ncbi:MAG: uncharacterized protein KVP18_000528 [Porospora cf. gigantea A]|uniref:uncharacterized protein n=1 Tax=Porospora cf. gigantea A TaxID=2853593 RepID=UPI00355A72F7|nr:MAG: hypothetical protein KVP18_000528 [Porospora cf. gigantea A]
MRAVTGDDHGQLKVVDFEKRLVRRHISDVHPERGINTMAWTGRHMEGESSAFCQAEDEVTVGRANGIVQAFELAEGAESKFELQPIRQFRLPSACVYVSSLARAMNAKSGLVSVGALGEIAIVDWRGQWKVPTKDSWMTMEESTSVLDPQWFSEIDCGKRMKNRTKKSLRLINPEKEKVQVDWSESLEVSNASKKKKSWFVTGYRTMGPVTKACLDEWTTAGRLLTGGEENDVKLFDLKEGRCLYAARNVRPNKLNYVTDIDVTALNFAGALGPELFLTGNREGSLRLYDIRVPKYPVMGCQGTIENRPISSIATRPPWVHQGSEEEASPAFRLLKRKTGCDDMGVVVADTHGMLYRYDLRRLDEPFRHRIYERDPNTQLSKRRKVARKLHSLDCGAGEIMFNEPNTHFEFQMMKSYRGIVGTPEAVHVHEDGCHLLASSMEGKLHVFNTRRQEIDQTLFLKNPVTSCLWSSHPVM